MKINFFNVYVKLYIYRYAAATAAKSLSRVRLCVTP